MYGKIYPIAAFLAVGLWGLTLRAEAGELYTGVSASLESAQLGYVR